MPSKHPTIIINRVSMKNNNSNHPCCCLPNRALEMRANGTLVGAIRLDKNIQPLSRFRSSTSTSSVDPDLSIGRTIFDKSIQARDLSADLVSLAVCEDLFEWQRSWCDRSCKYQQLDIIVDHWLIRQFLQFSLLRLFVVFLFGIAHKTSGQL